MKYLFVTMAVVAITFTSIATAQTYLGNLSANPFLTKAPSQPANTFNNPYGNSSNSPQLFNSQGQFRGNLNANPYDANSVAMRRADPYLKETRRVLAK
jgi:hypothetical protein